MHSCAKSLQAPCKLTCVCSDAVPSLLRHPAQTPDSSLTCKRARGLPEGTCWAGVSTPTEAHSSTRGSTSEPLLPAYVDKQDTRVLGLHPVGPPCLGQVADDGGQDAGFALQAVLALPRDHLQGAATATGPSAAAQPAAEG